MVNMKPRISAKVAAGFAIVVLTAVAGFAAPVAAQPEYPPGPVINTDTNVAVDGEIITIRGFGFLPNAEVVLTIVGGPVTQPASAAVAGVASQTQPDEANAAAEALGGIIIGSTTSDANGDWVFEWDTTGFPDGAYDVAATDGVNTLAVVLELVPPVNPAPPDPSGPGLPQTGGVAQGPLRAGALLVAVGGLVLLAVRNRRPTAHART